MIDLILIIGFCLYVGYQVGMSVTAYRLRHLLLKDAKEKGYDIEKYAVTQQSPMVYQLQIEQINDVLYLYDRVGNEFICQAKSIEELAELANKYKNIKYAAVLHNNKAYSFVDGKLKTKHES